MKNGKKTLKHIDDGECAVTFISDDCGREYKMSAAPFNEMNVSELHNNYITRVQSTVKLKTANC